MHAPELSRFSFRFHRFAITTFSRYFRRSGIQLLTLSLVLPVSTIAAIQIDSAE